MFRLERRSAVLGLIGFALVGLTWHIAVNSVARMATFPNSLEAGGAAFDQLSSAEFWRQIRTSSFRWSAGLSLAIVTGIPLGLAMGRSRIVHRLVDPVLTALYPIPKASLILLFVLVWGTGDTPRILAIATGAVIPTIVSSYHGAAGIDERLLWSGRALGRTGLRSMASLVLPAALPLILSGVRIAVSISIFVLVAAELLVRGSGIGNYLFNFYDTGQNQEVWGTALALAVVGFVIDAAYVGAVRYATPWMDGEV